MKVFLRSLLITAMLITPALAAEPPITVSVHPLQQVALDRASVRVDITVPQDALNRALCVVVDGPVYQSFCREIAGQAGARRTERWFRDLTPGTYLAIGELTRVDATVKRMTVTFRVIGPGEDVGVAEEP